MSISNEEKFQHHFDQGDNYSNQGLYDQAIMEYKEALREAADPEDPDFQLTLFKLVLALRDNGQWEKARLACSKLLKLTPEDAHTHEVMGTIVAGMGDYDKAVDCYHKALRLDPISVDAYHNLGIALKESGRYEEAAQAYQAALRLAPEEPDIHYSYGNSLRRLNRLDKAVTEYEAAIKLRPDYADAYNNLGLTLNDMGRHKEASEACRRGLDFAPGDPGLQLNLQDAFDGQIDITYT